MSLIRIYYGQVNIVVINFINSLNSLSYLKIQDNCRRESRDISKGKLFVTSVIEYYISF